MKMCKISTFFIIFYHIVLFILEKMNVTDLTLIHTEVLDEPKQRKIHLTP